MSQGVEEWKVPLLKALKERDLVEKKSDEIFSTFNTLYTRLSRSDDLVSKLRSDNLQGEYEKILKENEQLRASLTTKNDKLHKLEESLSILKNKQSNSAKEIHKLNKIITKLTNKLNDQSEEYQYKNKSIELLNDEFLSLNIQNNLLYDKLSKLEKENEELITRWMEKVKSDADKMNETNENQ